MSRVIPVPCLFGAGLLIQIVLLVLVYGQTAGFDYVYMDDSRYVLDNVQVASGLSFEGVHWALTSLYASMWHPLTWMSHMLDVSLFGLAPGPAHLHNLALHGVVSLLVWIYLRRFSGDVIAFVMSLLFLVHPMRVESVAWIAERKDLLSALFFLLALVFYDRFRRTPSIARYAWVMAMYILAVMSKAMAVTLPAVLLILDVCWYCRAHDAAGFLPRLRNAPLAALVEKLPLFAVAVAVSAVAIIAARTGGAMVAAETVEVSERVLNAGYSYLVYLRQSVFPLRLSAFYPLDMHKSLGAILVPAMLLLIWLAAAIRCWRSRPLLAAGLAWYLVTLSPVIGLFQVGTQLHADRFMYLPSIGLLLALGAVFPRPGSSRFRLSMAVSIILVAFGTLLAHWQTAYWENREVLFTRILTVVGPNWPSHISLAAEYTERREFSRALEHGEAAMRLVPERPEPYQVLGDIAMRSGDPEAAARYYLAGLEYAAPTALLLNNLAMAQLALGRYAEARQSLALALAMEPEVVMIRANLARLERDQQAQQQTVPRESQ